MFETHSQLEQHQSVAAGTIYPANTRAGEKLTLELYRHVDPFTQD